MNVRGLKYWYKSWLKASLLPLSQTQATPLISDPGYHLVSAVRDAGYRVVPIVGPCALIAGLSVSGLSTDRFSFYGFLPAKSSGRRQHLALLAKVTHTQVFYESPHRIVAMVDDIVSVIGPDRQLVLARELTKTFETVYGAPASKVQAWLSADHNQQKGEFVVLIEGAEPEQLQDILNGGQSDATGDGGNSRGSGEGDENEQRKKPCMIELLSYKVSNSAKATFNLASAR